MYLFLYFKWGCRMGLCEVPSVRISNLCTESANQLTVSTSVDLQICRWYGNFNFIIKCCFFLLAFCKFKVSIPLGAGFYLRHTLRSSLSTLFTSSQPDACLCYCFCCCFCLARLTQLKHQTEVECRVCRASGSGWARHNTNRWEPFEITWRVAEQTDRQTERETDIKNDRQIDTQFVISKLKHFPRDNFKFC